ncbi:MAG TPA: hypothetical protein VEA19_03485 [Actinomycetota bacterium]|nr:hypothetical protein [Actinomycetota bacterium]
MGGIENLQDEFGRIERAVASGQTDLRSLGFWKLVREVKRDPRLAAHWAEVVGRIDRAAFEARVRPRFPVWLGNGVLMAGTLVLAAAVAVALRLAEGIDRPRAGLAGILLIAAAGGLAVTVHAPAHWLVGRLGRMRFVAYFLDGPFRIQPGVKTDYATYLRASPGQRAAMHAAGALATKAAPFAVFLPAYLKHASAGYELLPEWSLWAVLGIGVLQIFTDAIWSVKHSDWKKVRREVRVGRTQAAER